MCDKLPYSNPRIDKYLIRIIQEINNEKQFKTLASCCGHGKYIKTIVVKEKNTGRIFEYFTKIELEPKKRNRFYKKDSEGFYYIPKIISN
jgi:tRNA(Phe) wybutosine-synthesizing methylase Tyw3